MENHFRDAALIAGMDPGGVEVLDIREHCAFVHAQDPAVTQIAADLITMGVSRLASTALPLPHAHALSRSALIIGSGLSGLTVASSLANAGHDVTLIDGASSLGGTSYVFQENSRTLIDGLIEAVSGHPKIDILLDSRLTQIAGSPGNYEANIMTGGRTNSLTVGAVVIATGAVLQPLDENQYFGPSVTTHAGFADELILATEVGDGLALNDIVMILPSDQGQEALSSPVCNRLAVRQATLAKQLNPDARVTLLFRDLFSAGDINPLDDAILEAKELGIAFFRYRAVTPPVISEKTVDLYDPLTGEPLRIPFDRVVLSTPIVPHDSAGSVAALLGLEQDRQGFLIEARTRLRPGAFSDPGLYVVGNAHQPMDTTDVLLQAYLTSSRLQNFLNQESISTSAPVAEIAADICTGCGNCAQVCPQNAIQFIAGEGVLSLAEVEVLRCTGCGSCAVVCPVNAITIPGWNDLALIAQISAAFTSYPGEGEKAAIPELPRILAFACEWSAYASADLAGARRNQYPSDLRIMRMNCSARFDTRHILWALLNNVDGVFLGACHPGDCHYGSGNLYAEERVQGLKEQLADYGLDSRRVRLEFLAADDGEAFVNSITAFQDDLKKKMVNP
jgi:heterodisulfide reductase subunit A